MNKQFPAWICFTLPPEHVGIKEIPGSAGPDNRPSLGTRIDQPFRGKDLDRLAHDRSAHSQVLTEGRLLGKRLSRQHVAADDATAQIVNYLSAEILPHGLIQG